MLDANALKFVARLQSGDLNEPLFAVSHLSPATRYLMRIHSLDQAHLSADIEPALVRFETPSDPSSSSLPAASEPMSSARIEPLDSELSGGGARDKLVAALISTRSTPTNFGATGRQVDVRGNGGQLRQRLQQQQQQPLSLSSSLWSSLKSLASGDWLTGSRKEQSLIDSGASAARPRLASTVSYSSSSQRSRALSSGALNPSSFGFGGGVADALVYGALCVLLLASLGTLLLVRRRWLVRQRQRRGHCRRNRAQQRRLSPKPASSTTTTAATSTTASSSKGLKGSGSSSNDDDNDELDIDAQMNDADEDDDDDEADHIDEKVTKYGRTCMTDALATLSGSCSDTSGCATGSDRSRQQQQKQLQSGCSTQVGGGAAGPHRLAAAQRRLSDGGQNLGDGAAVILQASHERSSVTSGAQVNPIRPMELSSISMQQQQQQSESNCIGRSRSSLCFDSLLNNSSNNNNHRDPVGFNGVGVGTNNFAPASATIALHRLISDANLASSQQSAQHSLCFQPQLPVGPMYQPGATCMIDQGGGSLCRQPKRSKFALSGSTDLIGSSAQTATTQSFIEQIRSAGARPIALEYTSSGDQLVHCVGSPAGPQSHLLAATQINQPNASASLMRHWRPYLIQATPNSTNSDDLSNHRSSSSATDTTLSNSVHNQQRNNKRQLARPSPMAHLHHMQQYSPASTTTTFLVQQSADAHIGAGDNEDECNYIELSRVLANDTTTCPAPDNCQQLANLIQQSFQVHASDPNNATTTTTTTNALHSSHCLTVDKAGNGLVAALAAGSAIPTSSTDQVHGSSCEHTIFASAVDKCNLYSVDRHHQPDQQLVVSPLSSTFTGNSLSHTDSSSFVSSSTTTRHQQANQRLPFDQSANVDQCDSYGTLRPTSVATEYMIDLSSNGSHNFSSETINSQRSSSKTGQQNNLKSAVSPKPPTSILRNFNSKQT